MFYSIILLRLESMRTFHQTILGKNRIYKLVYQPKLIEELLWHQRTERQIQLALRLRANYPSSQGSPTDL